MDTRGKTKGLVLNVVWRRYSLIHRWQRKKIDRTLARRLFLPPAIMADRFQPDRCFHFALAWRYSFRLRLFGHGDVCIPSPATEKINTGCFVLLCIHAGEREPEFIPG